MDTAEKARFINGYTRILTQAWSSAEFERRLVADPRAVLAENGLTTPAGAGVEIMRLSADPDLDAQITLWEDGAITGYYVLHVPPTGKHDSCCELCRS